MSEGRNSRQMIGRVPFLVLGIVILLAYSSLASALSLFVPTRLGTFNTEVVSYKEAKFKSIITTAV